MVDNFVSIHDGQNYLSRTRPNRYVLELTPATAASGSLTLFGKVSRIIVDASRSTVSGGAGASHGRFDMTMDIEDSGNNELKYIEQISNLNFTGAGTDQTNHFQVSEGANVKAGGSGTSVTLFAPISSTATVDSLAQDEGTAWDGMVVGKTTFTVSLSTGSFAAGTIRIIVILS